MTTVRESDVNPFLKGNYAPWRLESVADDLEITGTLPRELNGTFYRNGPNPAYEPVGRYHWFDGDGMIHAVRLRDGRASYRNRWVMSAGLQEERAAGRATFPGLLDLKPTEAPRFKNVANTNIVWHAGKLLALVESSLPTRLAPDTLATAGEYDFGGALMGPMTAHPKMDPVTGAMHFFGYAPFPPFLTYHHVDRDGRLTRSEPIDLAWPSMIHDFHITEHFVVFLLCPVVFSFENAMAGKGLFRWEPERGTRIGLMPRDGGSADVRWVDTDPSYVFHPMNAYEEGDTVVLDVCRYGRLDFMAPNEARDPKYREDNVARLHRWRIDRTAGTVASQPLDDLPSEFPRVDERRLGQRHRFGYVAVMDPDVYTQGMQMGWAAIRKYDLDAGTMVTRRFGAGNGVGEPLFVPRHADAAEDDGWLLVLAYDQERNASDFWVLDARHIDGEPVAIVHLPHRVPYGFHGNWVPGL